MRCLLFGILAFCPLSDGASLTWKEPPPSQVVQEAKDPVKHFSSRQLFEGTINATLRWRFNLTGLHFQSCAILFGGNTVALISSSVIGTPPSYAKRFGFDWIPNQHLMKLFIFNVSMKDNGTFSCRVTADTLDRFSEFHFKSHVLVDVVDVDECKNNICDANTVCNNTEGSYVCRCNEGYTGNGRICTDLNECESPETNQCDPNAECDNTEGSYTCNCSVGYTGDGKNCTAETCPIPMDTTFIIDASVCDKSENWNRVLNFVQTLVTYFDVSKPVGRIALIPFSTDAKVVLKLNSLSGELLNGKEVNKRVSALQCQGGSRRIDKALELAAKEVVTTENGLRAGVSRPVFVIVTGKQTTNQGASTSLAEASRRLQIQGSAVFVLGIGKDVDPKELSEIASGQKNVFTVNSFKDLEKKVHELKRGICVLDIDECASPETNYCDPNAECSNTKGSYTCSCNKGYTGDGRTCTAFITKSSSPSYAVEGQNLTLVWTYTLDGTVGLSQFAIVSGGSELLIGRRFGPGVITIEPGYQARFRARATKTRAELSILAVQRSDERTYRVNVVPTGAGSLVQSVDVIVNFPPTITEISGSQTVTEGSNVTLKCLADGKPMPNIIWTRLFDNRVVSMTLTDIRRQDAGRYRCIVDNGIGSPAATDVLIVVQYPVEAIGLGENARVPQGGSKTFSCPVSGNPKPNITWYRGNEVSGKPICYEEKLEARESGCYICVASNCVGKSVSITQCLEMSLPEH